MRRWSVVVALALVGCGELRSDPITRAAGDGGHELRDRPELVAKSF